MPSNHPAVACAGLLLVAQLQLSAWPRSLSATWNSTQNAAPGHFGEYQVKARYLSILPDYTKWPSGSGPEGRQLVIGVVGDSPFGNHLSDLFTPGKAMSRKGRVVYLQNRQGVEQCDVIFIPESESDRLYEILRKVRGRPILTIGDSPDFARRGVMINLVVDRDRVSLEVNLTTLRSAGLEVSAHILKNAKIIE